MDVNEIIASELRLSPRSVAATLELLTEGATIPFISRYRKEATGGLDEVQIFAISERYAQLQELSRRRAFILCTIEQQGALTDELRQRIGATLDPGELEDLYLPFKPRRRTRAQVAREQGLEPLAKMIMSQRCSDPQGATLKFVDAAKGVTDVKAALSGARDIIAEWVSEDATARERLRGRFRRFARINCTVVKGKEEEADNYRTYFHVDEPLQRCSSHRYLAMRRGQEEGLLRVSITIDDDRALDDLCRRFLRRDALPACQDLIKEAITDSYKRLLRPSMETEIAAEAKERADDAAIATFAANLRPLLLASPLGAKRVMAIDPGFRTGCKVVCLDAEGNLLAHDVIFPTPPRSDFSGSVRKLTRLAQLHGTQAVALGNGTASRETERFLRDMSWPSPVEIFVVSEAGASVYSASEVARQEFPSYDVTVRGAVSIGRRLQDPLAELVKIDPKSIGVGQYQHDVDQGKLKRSLDMTVEACVNSVGVNLNTASSQLLAYVAGIGPALAARIVEYRAANGPFPSRQALMQVPRLGAKAFEQCAGFLRVPSSSNILDNTAVHPERYALVEQMAADLHHTLQEVVADHSLLATLDLNRYVDDHGLGLPTLTDILHELEKPGRDPRERAEEFPFDDTIHTIDDLREGMVLPGIVNNITDFGAFVDLGIHTSGLIHVSQMAERRIRDPKEVVKINQRLRVKVLSVDPARGRISLTLRGLEQE